MKELLAAARGMEPCDLVIKGGRVANVLSLEYEDADVAVKDGIIVGVGSGYSGKTEVDASGMVVIPGLIDGHLHIESTLLSPLEFARTVVPHGTTTVMPDPHEIANTCGLSGIEFMAREAELSPLDFFYGAPPCVPASPYETPREAMDEMTMMECLTRQICTHLGEMMNYPGIIDGDDGLWSRISAANGLVRTGHAPGLSGRDLNAYMLSGCDSDHECTEASEALEKLRRGAWVMMRYGAMMQDLKKVIKVILDDESRYSRCMAVSDDLSVGYLIHLGHMDCKVRLMIEMGVRPLIALALVTICPARYFRLWERGAIAPGMIADMALVDSLESCRASKVWKRGSLVAEGGKALFDTSFSTSRTLPSAHSAKLDFTENALRVKAEPGKRIRVITVKSGDPLTGEMIAEPKVAGGCVVQDTDRDILKLVSADKNTDSGRIAVGFINGFGMKHGAIAASVAHDAHNYIAVGADDKSIETAMSCIARHGGGVAVASGDKVMAELPLNIGGLMTDMSAEELSRKLDQLMASALALTTMVEHPFMVLSFLSLTVIPTLRLTDKGLIDLGRGGVMPLFVD